MTDQSAGVESGAGDDDSRDVSGSRGGALGLLWEAARPHHWSKNALVAVPMLVGHETNGFNVTRVVLAAACFSLAASAGYLVNDLLDAKADRAHRSKRRRPIASGRLSAGTARVAAGAMIVAAVAVSALTLGVGCTAALLIYLALTLSYTAWLKHLALVDVLVLSGFYTLRVYAGGLAVDLPPSSWLLAFSTFLFLSLAFAKRRAELALHVPGGSNEAAREIEPLDGGPGESGAEVRVRGYRLADLPLLLGFGVASAFAAVLVFALYLDSAVVESLYAYPRVLWLVLPVLLYWLGRVWLLTMRGEMHDDPVVFALRDRLSWACGAVAVLLVLLAS